VRRAKRRTRLISMAGGEHHSQENDDGRHGHGGHHDHDHGHDGLGSALRGLMAPHSHDAKDSLDQALEASSDGIRTVALSLVILVATAGIQALVVLASGSVALLGDTLHNAADALTAVPLWMAFRLGRRPPTARFTYGYGKAEDVAGLAVIGLVGASAVFAGYEAIARAKGFLMVSASPLTRSSHHAGEDFAKLRAARDALAARP